MKNKLLASCLAAVASVAFASVASASPYFYNNVSVPYGVTGIITGSDTAGPRPAENVYVGQIKLTGTAPTAFDAFLYCLDIVDSLAHPGAFNTVTPLTAGPVPHAFASLSSAQIQQIGALSFNGSALITGTDANKDINSAATQLAIWEVEYGPYGTFQLNGLSGVANGLHSDPGLAVQTLATTFLSNVATPTSLWLNNVTYTVTLYQPIDPNTLQPLNSSQDLGISGAPSTTLTTPLPAALPLFAGGLGVMGLFGWRRKRKASAAAA